MSKLHDLCRTGAIDEINELLNKLTHVEIDRADADGNTPLHIACMEGHAEVVGALLKKGASRSAKNKLGKVAKDLVKDTRLMYTLENMGVSTINRYLDDANQADDRQFSNQTNKFYYACRNGDIQTVKNQLLTMKPEDIDQLQSNGSTALHAACYYNHLEIVRALLHAGASRTVKNKYGCLPYEETTMKEIKELFERIPGNNRFVGNTGKIEWVLVTPHVSETAAGERHALEFYRNRKLEDLASRIKSYYLATELQDIAGLDHIMALFEGAIEQKNPAFIIQAYTAETGFYSNLNRDLAGGAVAGKHERQFIVGIITHHPALDAYTYIGEAYRGMKVTEEDLQVYKVGSSIMTKSFLSATKDQETAKRFAQGVKVRTGKDGSILKFAAFCTYIIKNSRTALAIEEMSEYPPEREVLIMPYAVFCVKTIDRQDPNDKEKAIMHIVLEECEPFVPKF